MKRTSIVISVILVLIAALCGCGSNSAADNTIQPWSASDEQAEAALAILNSNGSSAFAEFHTDETYQTAKMGIEFYQDGKLKKDYKQGTSAIRAEGEKAAPSQGLAGFSVKDGIMTMGVSASGLHAIVSDIELPEYSAKDEGIAFTSIAEPQPITANQKIYLGVLNSESDSLNTAVLTDPDSRSGLSGKSWLFYVIFSTDPLE